MAGIPMPESDPDRIARLERELQALRLRVIALERLLGTTAAEHPEDRGTVERKAVYDWQT